jgi:hypothetical protein
LYAFGFQQTGNPHKALRQKKPPWLKEYRLSAGAPFPYHTLSFSAEKKVL